MTAVDHCRHEEHGGNDGGDVGETKTAVFVLFDPELFDLEYVLFDPHIHAVDHNNAVDDHLMAEYNLAADSRRQKRIVVMEAHTRSNLWTLIGRI